MRTGTLFVIWKCLNLITRLSMLSEHTSNTWIRRIRTATLVHSSTRNVGWWKSCHKEKMRWAPVRTTHRKAKTLHGNVQQITHTKWDQGCDWKMQIDLTVMGFNFVCYEVACRMGTSHVFLGFSYGLQFSGFWGAPAFNVSHGETVLRRSGGDEQLVASVILWRWRWRSMMLIMRLMWWCWV